jgi:hypothetical protein
MPDHDPAFYLRNAFNHHCSDMIGYAEAWCRAADIDPEEKAEAVRRLIVRLQDVVRVEVTW